MNDGVEKTEQEIAFDAIPPEVQQYVYSADFDDKLTALFSDLKIDGEKKDLLRGVLFGFIAQIEDEDAVLDRINETTADPVQRQKIIDWIAVNASEPIVKLISEAYISEEAWGDEEETNENNETDRGENSTPITSPQTNTSTSLSSLADRLKQASIATPVRREATFETSDTIPIAKPAIDPYHEPIDNE